MKHVITITRFAGSRIVVWRCSCRAAGEQDEAYATDGVGAEHIAPGDAVRYRP